MGSSGLGRTNHSGFPAAVQQGRDKPVARRGRADFEFVLVDAEGEMAPTG
jgi:hypothetical protein